MPVPNEIANAAATYRMNGEMLAKSFAGLTPEEWLRRPGESSNHLLWIVGHVIWARAAVLGLLGVQWSKPWAPLFSRGAKLGDAAQYPSPEEMAAAWTEVSAALTSALEAVSSEALAAPAPPRVPNFDGTVGGTVGFLGLHESLHVGQAAYLRTWLGHEGVAG
jgi:hypothetical protein